jgi:hypothetical protein
MSPDDIITIDEVARELRISVRAAYHYLEKWGITNYSHDRRWRVRRGDLYRPVSAPSRAVGENARQRMRDHYAKVSAERGDDWVH